MFMDEIINCNKWFSPHDPLNKTKELCIPTLSMNVFFESQQEKNMYVFTATQPRSYYQKKTNFKEYEKTFTSSIVSSLTIKLEDENRPECIKRAYEGFLGGNYNYNISETYMTLTVEGFKLTPVIKYKSFWKDYDRT